VAIGAALVHQRIRLLQRVAICCNALQCVVVWCSNLRRIRQVAVSTALVHYCIRIIACDDSARDHGRVLGLGAVDMCEVTYSYV